MEGFFDSIEIEKALEDVINNVTFREEGGTHSDSTRRVFEYYEEDGISGYFDRKGEEFECPSTGEQRFRSSFERQMFNGPIECCTRCGFDEDVIKKRGSLIEQRRNISGNLLPPITNTEYVRSVDYLSLITIEDDGDEELICRSCCWSPPLAPPGEYRRPICMDCGYSEILCVQNGGHYFEKDDREGSQGWRCSSCLHIHIFGQEYVIPGYEDLEYLPPLGEDWPAHVYRMEGDNEVYRGEYELDDSDDDGGDEQNIPSEKISRIKEILKDIDGLLFEIKDDIQKENNYLKIMSNLKEINDNVILLE